MDPKRILLAVDENESSRNAVRYVGRIVGSQPDFHITLMHVMEAPPDDFFAGEEERDSHLIELRARTDSLLDEAKAVLVSCGQDPDRIDFKAPLRTCASLAGCILDEATKSYGTLVVGRRGIPKPEELAFGSVSKRLLDHANKCAIWVIQ